LVKEIWFLGTFSSSLGATSDCGCGLWERPCELTLAVVWITQLIVYWHRGMLCRQTPEIFGPLPGLQNHDQWTLKNDKDVFRLAL
jgi:hypothetical protein